MFEQEQITLVVYAVSRFLPQFYSQYTASFLCMGIRFFIPLTAHWIVLYIV